MKKILIIDDDKFVTRIYEMKFQAAGYKVILAADGPTGLELAKTLNPDAILLDLILPGIRGADILIELRKDQRFARTPIVMFSNNKITLPETLLGNGATRVLWKSSNPPKQVVAEVIEVLENPAAAAAAPAASAIRPKTTRIIPADPDEEMHNQLRDSLIKSAPEVLSRFKTALAAIEANFKDTGGMFELLRTAHNLSGNAGLAGLPDIARLATGIEALGNKLLDAPEHSTASTTRTIKHAVDVIGRLFARPDVSLNFDDQPPRILVVDDQEIARRAASFSLQTVNLNGICLGDPETAFMVMKDNVFEVVFLDINMPQMSGMQFRDKMRAIESHKKTPIVFYSTATQLLTPEKLGDCDAIAKPFLSSELALKALAHSSQSRLSAAK